MSSSSKPRVLCVDDEPAVGAGIAANFRKELEIVALTSGELGLSAVEAGPPFAVVISDLHMPRMNGIAFLREVRRVAPDSIRILLTGNADVDTAVSAVNEGQLFRFLRKPTSQRELADVLGAALEQHKLVTAERVLLEQTLRGTVEALMDMLAVVNPLAFGQVSLLRRLAHELAVAVGAKNVWQVEVAAMFSQLATVALAPETLERLNRGAPLDDAERAAGHRGGRLVDRILASIPRLDVVHAILLEERQLRSPTHKSRDEGIALAAEVLRVARDYTLLAGQALEPDAILKKLRARGDRYDATVLDALERTVVGLGSPVVEVSLRGLLVGMVLAEDLHTTPGALLARRGYAITDNFLEKTVGYPRGFVREPVRVLAHSCPDAHGR
jgi:CheY-like chemotaxis protein